MQNDQELVLEILNKGELAIKGEFLWGSNYTFLVDVTHAQGSLAAVYKPTRGVRPLWDFPNTSLARRETAAFLVSEALTWRLVPPTIFRKKGPLGAGSVQLFIEHDPQYHYFNFSDEDRQRLLPVALFDLLVNNADRKGSHILIDPQKQLWLIDHGLCFHVEDKLRTVIWDFVDVLIPAPLLEDIERFSRQLRAGLVQDVDGSLPAWWASLRRCLSLAELRLLVQRAQTLLESGRFPAPDPARRHFPWPQI